MKRDRRQFDLSPEAEALLRTPDWERLELADGPVAQAMCPGIRARGWEAVSGPESGLADDLERNPDTPDMFDAG